MFLMLKMGHKNNQNVLIEARRTIIFNKPTFFFSQLTLLSLADGFKQQDSSADRHV